MVPSGFDLKQVSTAWAFRAKIVRLAAKIGANFMVKTSEEVPGIKTRE
jgi:hypothetical protein